MTDQELQKIAEETAQRILDGTTFDGWITDPEMKEFVLKGLTKVRDAQEEKLRIAREALEKIRDAELSFGDYDGKEMWICEATETSDVAKEALEKLGEK